MAAADRFHLDQDGHSITVQLGRTPSSEFEVLVDGKVVAYHRGGGTTNTVTAELPGDPPQPLSITLSQAREMGDVPSCVLEIGGMRYLMPWVPLVGSRGEPEGRGASHPVRQLRRMLRRWARRRRRRGPRRR